jgi:tetratricopeptide (TPR) repeat protein
MESLKPRAGAAVARAPRPLPITIPAPASTAPPIMELPAAGSAPSIAATNAPAAQAPDAAPANGAIAPVAAAPKAATRKDVVASLLEEARSPAAARPDLKLERSSDRPTIAAGVAEGYRQLLAGDLPGARRSYSNAFAADASNVDAQLGLATVEARLGNRAEAASLYRGVLELDPRNGTALAALAALAEDVRPDAMQESLQAAIARTPDAAALHFALGNAYAAQSRWPEAQAEYYEAHRLDPGDADTAYNLAVSLDHLGQTRAAAGLYARALANARKGAQFDAASVARRLAELK